MACTGHNSVIACTGHNTVANCTGHNTIANCTAHTTTVSCHSHNTIYGCIYHNSTANCTAHNTTSGCTSHNAAAGAGPCTTNLTTFTDPTLDTNTKVKAVHINELRAAIDAERVRRGYGQTWSGAQVTAGSSLVDDNDVKSLKTALDAVISGLTWPLIDAIVEGSSEIDDAQINEARANVNTAEGGCTCHCNYTCTCNCNYSCTCYCNYSCTCYCNYSCTCNCNYSCTCYCNYSCTCYCNYSCTCNCNYACTCNCNYSDETLKKDIVYL